MLLKSLRTPTNKLGSVIMVDIKNIKLYWIKVRVDAKNSIFNLNCSKIYNSKYVILRNLILISYKKPPLGE
jgi:hypothetical protein